MITMGLTLEKSKKFNRTGKVYSFVSYRATNFLIKFKTPKGRNKQWNVTERGAIVELKRKLEGINVPSTFASISKYLKKKPCSVCHGKKLSAELLESYICGYNIGAVEQLPASELKCWCDDIRNEFSTSPDMNQIELLLLNIERRVQHLIDLNLEHISISRSIPRFPGRIAASSPCYSIRLQSHWFAIHSR